MALNENIIIKKLEDKLKDVDVRNAYRMVIKRLKVKEVSQFFDLGNDYYVLISPTLNTDAYSILRMRSVDNSFITSPNDYVANEANQNQIFNNYLELDIYECDEFKEFELEFLVFVPKILNRKRR